MQSAWSRGIIKIVNVRGLQIAVYKEENKQGRAGLL